jgi:Uma2 family endonuclease
MSDTLAAPYVTLPPTQAELPCDDGIPMETQRHKYQMDLLIETLELWLAQREDGFVSGNMFVYYSLAQVRNKDFKGPDFFVVLDIPKGERRSWVVWEEGKAPDVVIELLSESTAQADKNEKKLIYQAANARAQNISGLIRLILMIGQVSPFNKEFTSPWFPMSEISW